MSPVVVMSVLPCWGAGSPGLGVIRRIVDETRAGRVVERLPFTYRLVTLAVGEG